MRLTVFALVMVFAALLFVGGYTSTSAQDPLPEATVFFTSDMMRMNSSCPQNVVSALVDRLAMVRMDATAEPIDNATEESPMMGATEEAMMTAEAGMGSLCVIGAFSGDAEIPDPGAEDAFGLVFVTFDQTTGEVCYEVAVANIELPAQAMHIHIGEMNESGGIVIPFPTAPDEQGQAVGCTTADDLTVLEDLAANPEGYYVNVHTTDFSAGAARAQLMAFETEGQQMLESMGLQLFDLRGDTADITPEPTLGS